MVVKTCLNINCPERKGGKCTAKGDPGMGIEEWVNHGKKYGYWQFFRQKIRTEVVDQLSKFTNQNVMNKYLESILNE